jgi:phosphate transport system substrate-binding protein
MNIHRVLVAALLLCAPALGFADIRLPESEHVEIRGTPAMGAVARLVAERFMSDHPEATVTVAGGGTRRGLKSLVMGTSDLAMATDGIAEDVAKLAADKGVKLVAHPVFSDAVVVVVNPANPVQNLSMRDLRDIFRGKIVRWSDVGRDGADAVAQPRAGAGAARSAVSLDASKRAAGQPAARPPSGGKPGSGAGATDGAVADDRDIEVITFEGNQGPYETFKKQVLGDEFVITPRAREVAPKDVHDAITEKAIGYVSLHGVKGLKALTIDGVVGSVETIHAGRYAINRNLVLYAREPVSPPVAAVLTYFEDPAIGQKIAESLGNVPVK